MKVDPFELPPTCKQTCDKGSRCTLLDGHQPADYHVTEHGCVCLSPKLDNKLAVQGSRDSR